MNNKYQDTVLQLPEGSCETQTTAGWLNVKGFNLPNGTPYIISTSRDGTRVFTHVFKPTSELIKDHPIVEWLKENDMMDIAIVVFPLPTVDGYLAFTRSTKFEINNLLKRHPDAIAVYVVAHRTAGHPLQVSVGGDCYRPDRGNLLAMLDRTKELSTGMLRKSAMIFPDIPALCGGKKGEFGILDENYVSISKGLTSEALFEISAAVMPFGIGFLNSQKLSMVTGSKDNFLFPDSLSPDVFTGQRWPKYTDYWLHRGVDPGMITCLPNCDNAMSSSKPTAVGVIATCKTLADALLIGGLSDKRILMEGFGGVGQLAADILVEGHGVLRKNVTIVDPDPDACKKAEAMGFNVFESDGNSFYKQLDPSSGLYDIWINNGVGDTVGLFEVNKLIACGVKVYVGGANNLFKVSQLDDILTAIASSSGFAFPDWATSGGGWTYAILQQVKKKRPDLHVDALSIIADRNEKAVHNALFNFTPGQNLWKLVADRAQATIDNVVKLQDQLKDEDFNCSNWNL